jgi:hypothetical protein
MVYLRIRPNPECNEIGWCKTFVRLYGRLVIYIKKNNNKPIIIINIINKKLINKIITTSFIIDWMNNIINNVFVSPFSSLCIILIGTNYSK